MELCCERKITVPFKPFEIPFQIQNSNYKSVETKTFLMSTFFSLLLSFSLSVFFLAFYILNTPSKHDSFLLPRKEEN